MRLRSHLQILTVGTLLPVVVFGLAAGAVIADRERDLVRRGGTERTLALLTAVDAELSGYAQSLQALASSAALERRDLEGFHREARRALRIQQGWRDVRLARPDGTIVLDAALPFGTAPDRVHERPSFEDVIAQRRHTIRSLYPEPDGSHLFGVRAPVVIDDSLEYVVSALVDPRETHELLERQRLPEDWVGVVLDANHRIVARTMESEATIGRLAEVDLRDALARESEGWFRGWSIEGEDVYMPFTRSPLTGWTVAIGIPVEGVHSSAAEMGWLFAAGIIAALLAAILLANGLSRRILRPIGSLAAAARAIGRGEPIDPPTSAAVREVREVSYVLSRAATRVREREAALWAADQAKDEFIAMLGHELRNPLAALMSAAEVLELSGSTGTADSARRAGGVIDRQVRHMTRLVDDLLDVSRLTTGKVNLEFEPLDLAEAVESVLDTFETGGRLARHEIRLDISSIWIDGDRSRIEQVVANLLGNALKYTPENGRINVRVRGRSEDGGEAVLEVEDTGAGLSPDLAPRVFESFVQGERPLDRKAGGLGLGLTLVRSLVGRHRGTVEAHSEGPGRGTRFTVRLPAIAPPAHAEHARRDAGAAAGGESRRVVLIEDNEDARETLTTALELLGHEVLTAPDGESGLALVRERAPDLAIIDIGLPRMDGFEVARRLRQEAAMDGQDGRPVRLVALTGYSQGETRSRAMSAGFDRSLTKPVGLDELTRIIDELLAESSARA